ncbi:MAG: class I SAM-dependent rRNA methyltransferase [Verrucomicrobia bacterium]|nr:class I SAM-dependent rRNA methyltransferase [Verrucomicrobiota bacterium]
MHSQRAKMWLEKIPAAQRRRKRMVPPDTDAFRLVDGGGDHLSGVTIDAFAGRWLVETRPDLTLPPFPPELGFRSLYHIARSPDQRQGPVHIGGEPVPEPFLVQESGCKFWIDFQSGYSQGLFLDQRDNRAEVRRSSGRDKTVLNTFAYTCAFGLAAALGGAHTVNLDLSRHYLDWGKRNYTANGIDPGTHDFIYGDVFDWIRRFHRRERRFDLVILDPPTFSRDRHRSRVFRVERDYGALVELASGVLAAGGRMLCCANTHRLPAARFEAILRASLSPPVRLSGRRMPPDFTGSDYLKTFWVEP